jgi:parallel beta-helix repeat protein
VEKESADQVFISYSRKDLGFVEHLAADLQSAGLKVWYDLSGLEVGARWGQEISRAIRKSRYFLVLLSPNSSESEWVEKEYIYANNFRLNIVPVLYKPCILPLWAGNLHYIELNEDNYQARLPALLKILGVKEEEKPVGTPPGQEIPLPMAEQEISAPGKDTSPPGDMEPAEKPPLQDGSIGKPAGIPIQAFHSSADETPPLMGGVPPARVDEASKQPASVKKPQRMSRMDHPGKQKIRPAGFNWRKFMLVITLVILAAAASLGLGYPAYLQITSRTITVTTTADGGVGSLRQGLLDARPWDTITFDSRVFPPEDPAVITLDTDLPALTRGHLLLDAGNAGVILDGTNLGDLPESVLLDDISLSVDGGSNLLDNGSFTSDTSHWRGWDERLGVVRELSTDYHSSPYSLSITSSPRIGLSFTVYDTTSSDEFLGVLGTSPGPGETSLIQMDGQEGKVSFWFKGGAPRVVISMIYEDGSTLYFRDKTFEPSSEWSQGNIDFSLPGDAAGISITFLLLSPAKGNGLTIASDGNVIHGLQLINFPSCSLALLNGSDRNTIGGDRTVGSGPMGQGNLFSGTGNRGICISPAASRNTVVGNFIGTTLDGRQAWGLNTMGIWLSGNQNTLENNVISGVGYLGLWLGFGLETARSQDGWSTENLIRGNFIGTDPSGLLPVPNGEGVNIGDGASKNTLGPDNVISFNTRGGIAIFRHGTLGNTITGNSIHDNAYGISLSSGGNNELVPPVSETAASTSLSGTACPGCRVEIFSDTAGQGETYEGWTTADDEGNFFYINETAFSGPYLTATTTDSDGNTSGFSLPVSLPSNPYSPLSPEMGITRTQTASITNAPLQTLTSTITFTPTNSPTFGSGSTRIRSRDGMTMVYLPAGEFIMGQKTDEGRLWCQLFERSLCHQEFFDTYHSVYLDSYWIDQTEVTNSMYSACVEAGVCQAPQNRYIGGTEYYGITDYFDYPILNVSWDSASTYCQWAGARLPTDAEWEKAARGVDGRPYPWGDTTPSCSLANFAGIYDMSCPYNWCDCVGFPTRVGSYLTGVSPFGALDMAGNAPELVSDWYRLDTRGDYYISTPAYNPTGPTAGSYKVLRCGQWDSTPTGILSTCRSPIDAGDGPGFRCALSLEP